MEKKLFVGRTALTRLATLPPSRVLRSFTFPGTRAPRDGAQLVAGTERVGYLTSSRFSPVLGHGVALGWVYDSGRGFPTEVEAIDGSDTRMAGSVTHGPFYDPEGARLRA